MDMDTNGSPVPDDKPADEPPVKKSKIAEEALKKIEEQKRKAEQDKLEAEERARNAKKAELEKLRKVVTDDPADFTGWTQLLQYVDSNNEQEEGRTVFRNFLNRYPYCYGYWKKYADFEKRNGTPSTVIQVFEEVRKSLLKFDKVMQQQFQLRVIICDNQFKKSLVTFVTL